MRKFALLTVVLAALFAAPQALAQTVTVQILKSGFSPENVTVGRNDTVVWMNADKTKHQVVGDNGSFQSPVLAPGKSYSHMFGVAGTFGYHGTLHPTLRGAVAVHTVSVGASRTLLTYGTSTRLSGRVSNGMAGEEVTIRAEPFDQPARLTTVTTEAGGFWSLRVYPLIKTTYTATWGTIASDVTKTVLVRPRLNLRRRHHGYYSVTLFDLNQLPNNHVWISRWSPLQRRYVHVARIFLDPTSRKVIWKATFRLHVRHGTKLKAFITGYQAGPGYLGGTSDPVWS
jgi:plastocyanin